MSVHGNRKESVDAFLDGRNHEKYHYFCCSSGSSGNIYSFVLSHCCRKSGREKTDRNHEKRVKTNKDLIIEPNAAIEGRKYSEEKPWSCKYCYWWGGKKKGCNLKQCHYLLPEKKKAVKTTPCGGCPYGKHVPCIGYCIARLHSEMKGKKGRG